ncbi:hypothetical protein PALU110988_24930 [Paenibacillus lupini]|uniref:hypothetical protein n=1 Tax=Paenibacillus lupini TaxID=1450204 RepID=UPI00141EC0F6|nr:hypothetical protein [Paenibacillus lupini]NIK21734.1 hypothetical protein [Paenibacillus lupini]
MKKEDWIIVILVVSLIGNVALLIDHRHVNKDQELKHELFYANIWRDLSQLEVTIQYQIDNNWSNETLITQKLDDAIDSIILDTAMENDDDKEDILWKLYEYMEEFRFDGDTLDVSLNDKQRTDYINLGKKLRSSGWTFNAAYDMSWSTIKSKVEDLTLES